MSGAGAPQRILVVDHDPEICRLIRDALRQSGYPVDIGEDGLDLLARCHLGGYGLLILDVQPMRHVSALELVVKLRDRGNPVGVVLLAGPPRAADRVESFAFTYRVDVVRKPFGLVELRSTVERATRRQK